MENGVLRGDWVQVNWMGARKEEGEEAVAKGDVGEVLFVDDDLLTVYLHRTEDVVTLHAETVGVLCGADFAEDEASTPARQRTEYVRRGGV